MIVLGVDPSLASTGIARVETQDRLHVTVSTIRTAGKRGDSLPERHDRLVSITEEIEQHALGNTYPDRQCAGLVVIEAPAYDSRTGHQHDRSGLWWLTVHRLRMLGIPVASVTTGGLKKYATGKGAAPKDTVLLAVARRFPHVETTNNNEADAVVLMAMGADWHGEPVIDMPKAHRDALAKVEWP